jgi:hypothetical protein
MSIKVQGNVVIDDTSNFTANTITYTGSMYENFASPTISSGTLTLDLSQGNLFNVAYNAAVNTLTISNTTTNKASVFALILNYNGTGYSFTWPASVRWPSGVTPVLTNTNGKRDMFTFVTFDNGTSYNATISGQNF